MTDAVMEVRRARPLLGTLVEISATARTHALANAAIDAAFACVTRVHDLMSFHRRGSDVDRLNLLALHRPVAVHPWTWQVLLTAQRLSRSTRGAFDVTAGGLLMRWGYLPKRRRGLFDQRADWQDVQLLPGHRVYFRRRLFIDLGGIAKGFAVDRAVERLRAAGACSGLVNAGGDLRVFGNASRRIHLRHPASPGRLLAGPELLNSAAATTAHYFARRSWHTMSVTPVVDGRHRRACIDPSSVTVTASTCMIADALTKVCMLRGPGMVRRFGGKALILETEDLGLSG